MIERIVSVTIFLSLVLLLRAVFYNRVSRRMGYAMWLVVGIYLLVPFGEFTNSFQVLNVVYRVADSGSGTGAEGQDLGSPQAEPGYDMQKMTDLAEAAAKRQIENEDTQKYAIEERQKQDRKDYTDRHLSESGIAADTESAVDNQMQLESDGGQARSLTPGIGWIKVFWMIGCAACAMLFAGSNLHFAKRLRTGRKLLSTDRVYRRRTGNGSIPVYQTAEISTPCLFGVFCPAVYLPAGHMEPEICEYVLAHEYTHYKHGDSIWAVLRCLCISLYWYHPLVWTAALLSVRDSEFACDESVIRSYDAMERKAYGETLILFGTGGKDRMGLFTASTGIAGGNKELKKRIQLIAAQGKQRAGTAVLACVLLFGVTGCTVGSSAVGNELRESEERVENENRESAIKEAVEEKEMSGQKENVDLVPELFDFASILNKTEENGIEYYKVITEKDIPLPLNEWAKINIYTEQGNMVDAYVRFTKVIRDAAQVEEHIDNYVKAMEIKEPFGTPLTDRMQYILLQYEIMIAGDARIEENDRIPAIAFNYPLQLYSTLENGLFPVQGIERSVCDISIAEKDSMEPGDIIQKEVVCYIPTEYTAYGIELTYMTAQRTTDMVYFKPEYE